ncbi:MAG TPA: hypothetical protein VF552_00860 [Allosphingosinicella sp.]
MPSYRYRTAVVVGRWRAARRDALADAVKSGFARWDGAPWDKVTWRFPGEIEECGEDPAACERKDNPRAARG